MAEIKINSIDEEVFSGLYESIWENSDKGLDEIMEMASDLGVDAAEIDVALDFSGYLKDIVELYQRYFQAELDGTWSIDTIYSPKYYNYTTDQFTLAWKNEEMSEKVMRKAFVDLIDNAGGHQDFETNEIYDNENGYELYNNFVKYTIDGKEIYFSTEEQKYVID